MSYFFRKLYERTNLSSQRNMNYLAHSYLSFEDDEVLFGNFIGDFVKGKKRMLEFPSKVQKGLMLHREIDRFTDNHKATIRSRKLVQNELSITSGIFVDMIYDHILANFWKDFSDLELKVYTTSIYNRIDQFESFFDPKFAYMYGYMKEGDWLFHYSKKEYMTRFLKGVSNRVKIENNLDNSFWLYENFKSELEGNFLELFQDLIKISKTY